VEEGDIIVAVRPPTKPSVFLFETESILRRQAEATQLRNIVGCLALVITDRTIGVGWAIR